MKVGDYVRFDYHKVSVPIQIAKITETHYDSEDDSNCYSTDIGLVIDESNLVKEPSPEIINLVQVGDYVNGMQVTRICFDEDGERILNLSNCILELMNEDIKSIVTKEQFSSMEYKVGE